jgi:hypothetical protein
LIKSGKSNTGSFDFIPAGRTNRENFGNDKIDDIDDTDKIGKIGNTDKINAKINAEINDPRTNVTIGNHDSFGFAPEHYSKRVSAKGAVFAAFLMFLLGVILGGGGVYYYFNIFLS